MSLLAFLWLPDILGEEIWKDITNWLLNTPTLCRCLEVLKGLDGSMLDYLTTRASLSPIRRGFVPSFVNYKKGCTRLAAASDKVYQLLAHGRWFSPGTPASSATKTDRHDIAEILLKVALNTKDQGIQHIGAHTLVSIIRFVARSQLPITTWPPRPYRVWYLILSLMSCILQEPATQIYIFQEHHCLFSCSRHDIAEILLKLALNTNQSIDLFILCWVCNLMVTNIKPDFFLIKHQK